VKTFSGEKIVFREDGFARRCMPAGSPSISLRHTELYVGPRHALDFIPDPADMFERPSPIPLRSRPIWSRAR